MTRSYQDISLTCRDCGKSFLFTAGEQEFYSQKGFLHTPVRCPNCRRARKQRPKLVQPPEHPTDD